ncbi:FAD synthase [Halobacteriales archaeon QH_10_65_19]|nr:MAG: FAD synthase [Halobacteriales archaeon QH_10_65_19]
MRHVVAQGTFDLLHPGHVHYLRDARLMGDKLHAIVARQSNVTHKPDPVIPGPQRVEMVSALEPVDHARLGHPEDIFVPIEEINPDVIALGYDQHHDIDAIESQLADRGIDCDVRRASARERTSENELLSSGEIVEKILAERGGD